MNQDQAAAAGHPPDRPQHFLARASWDEQQVTVQAARWAIEYLDDGDTGHTVLIIDETADAKSSIDAAGRTGSASRRRRLLATYRAAETACGKALAPDKSAMLIKDLRKAIQ